VSRTAARRWLWLAALVTMPVPFYLGEIESAPVVRLAFLTSLLSLVLAAEGGRTLFVVFGVLQTALYTSLFYLAAFFGERGVDRIVRPPLRGLAVGSVLLVLFASSLLSIYQTPLSSTRLHSNLWHLFE
jgi:hypothetical protein